VGAVAIDCTLGQAGHAREILERITPGGRLLGIDRDPTAVDAARVALAQFGPAVVLANGRFSELSSIGADKGFLTADLILFDFGLSSNQIDAPERGFSFQSEGPLDMRMDQTRGITAADIVNQYDEKTLADLIYQLGEERRARRIARAIVRARPLRSTLHLADVVERAVPRTGRLHPATKTFMALRMAVNDEPGELAKLLESGPELLRSGGRMVAISFMSSDDRQVKEKFRSLAREGRATLLTKHPLEPTEEEVARNNASRSAKLRAIEMV